MTCDEAKSVRILDLIERSGGMRFRDIQRAVWAMDHDGPLPSDQRGYWSTSLTGTSYMWRPGLLPFFCVKGKDGLWRRNRRAHRGRPWSVIRASEGYGTLAGPPRRRPNARRRTGRRRLRA